MKQPEQLAFDYGSLDKSTREFVKERAAQIHQAARATAAGIVRIGQWLTEVKERLREYNKGRSREDQERLGFLTWIKAEFQWKKSSAENFMLVYQNVKLPNFGNLEIDVSALYLIAAPKTPEPVRAEVIHRLDMGEKVTHSEVKSVVAEYNRTGDAPKAVAKLFDAVRVAKQAEIEQKRMLPSPAEARKVAIETGAHTLDRNGVYQPPMTVEDQAQWRADWKRVGMLADFIRWAASTSDSPETLADLVKDRRWKGDFKAADRRAAVELLKLFDERL